jgi:hypothetical protein
MNDEKPDLPEYTEVRDAHELSTLALMREVTTKAAALVRKEIELARAELKQDLQTELTTVKALGVAAVLGIAALTLLLVAGALGLASVMPAWGAALVVAAATAVAAGIAGGIGWSRRVTRPLATTRKTLEEDVGWAKERMS